MTQLVKKDAKVRTILGLLERAMPTIRDVVPKHVTPERLTKLFTKQLRQTPKLAECNAYSLINALIGASELGLETGGVSGMAHLVPFKDECTLIVGYKGLESLAMRSGQVASIRPRTVYGNDTYELEYGLHPKLKHTPTDGDRGEMVAVYAVATFTNGAPPDFVWLWRKDVDKVRDATAGYKSGRSTPWKTHYEEMAEKTAVRRLCKHLPMSADLQRAVAIDEQGERGERQTFEHEFVDGAASGPSKPQSLDDLVDSGAPEPEPAKPKPAKPNTSAKAVEQAEKLKAVEKERTDIKIAIAEKWNAMSVGQQTAAAKNLNIVGGIQGIDKLPLDELQSIRDGLISAAG